MSIFREWFKLQKCYLLITDCWDVKILWEGEDQNYRGQTETELTPSPQWLEGWILLGGQMTLLGDIGSLGPSPATFTHDIACSWSEELRVKG